MQLLPAHNAADAAVDRQDLAVLSTIAKSVHRSVHRCVSHQLSDALAARTRKFCPAESDAACARS